MPQITQQRQQRPIITFKQQTQKPHNWQKAECPQSLRCYHLKRDQVQTQATVLPNKRGLAQETDPQKSQLPWPDLARFSQPRGCQQDWHRVKCGEDSKQHQSLAQKKVPIQSHYFSSKKHEVFHPVFTSTLYSCKDVNRTVHSCPTSQIKGEDKDDKPVL